MSLCVVCEPVAPGSLVEMQALRPCLKLLSQNMHFYKIPSSSAHTKAVAHNPGCTREPPRIKTKQTKTKIYTNNIKQQQQTPN